MRPRIHSAWRSRSAALDAAFASSPVGYLRTRPDGTVMGANGTLATWLGTTPEALRGRDAAELERLPALEFAWHDCRDAAGTVRARFAIVQDQSERVRIEAELQRAAREHEILLEGANVGLVMTVGHRQVWINRWVEDTYGYTRAELLGAPMSVYMPSQADYQAFEDRACPVLMRGEAYEADVEQRRKDGTPLWVHVTGRFIAPDDPRQGTLWVTVDRTRWREIDHALRQSEARFRTLFERHASVMLLVDPCSPAPGRIVDANDAAARFYGYPRETLQGMGVRDLNMLPPAAVEARLAAAQGGIENAFIFPHRLADGALRTVEVRSSPVEIDGRRLLFSIVHDVTERERTREALDRERQRYRTLMEIAQDGIHLVDVTGLLVEANEAFLTSLGLTRADVGRARIADWDVHFSAEALPAIMAELIRRPRVFPTRHRRTDGTIIDVEINAGGVELDGQVYVLASARDVSTRKAIELALATQSAELAALNAGLAERVQVAVNELREKDRLLLLKSRQAAMGEAIGNVAHQWRQPLNALSLVLTNLRDAARYGELEAAQVEREVAEGLRLVQKMSSTINDFRDFFRPRREKVAFSATAELQEALRLFAGTFQQAGIACTLDGPAPGQDIVLFGFPNEYSQVVLNLLTNAAQAIRASRRSQGRVVLRLRHHDGGGLLTVEDNGGGFAPGVRDRLFEPYFSTKEGGTGIGLYMSRQIVTQSLGGRIEAREGPEGARFELWLPAFTATPLPTPVSPAP